MTTDNIDAYNVHALYHDWRNSERCAIHCAMICDDDGVTPIDWMELDDEAQVDLEFALLKHVDVAHPYVKPHVVTSCY